MHRRHSVGAAFTTLAAIVLAFYDQGCSASTEGTGAVSVSASGSGGSGGAAEAASTSSVGGAGGNGAGGAGGSAPKCDPYDGVVLAVDEIYLGANGFDGTQASDAWKEFGFDLDGQTTGADTSMHCLPVMEGTTTAFGDGPMGRDNSFGRNVLPAVNALVPPLDQQANNAIAMGQFTQLFAFEGLGSEANVDKLMTRVFGGAPLGNVPTWDGLDCWPLLHETLKDPGDPSSAKTHFAESKLVNNRWDSNGTQDFVLALNVAGITVPVTIYKARMSVQLASTHEGGALGQIGGFVKTEEFVKSVRVVAGVLGQTACDAFDSVLANQIRRSSDLLDDGTQDPTKTCNAISVGIGFTLRKVALGGVAKPAKPLDDACN
jgi:hypothetical protein